MARYIFISVLLIVASTFNSVSQDVADTSAGNDNDDEQNNVLVNAQVVKGGNAFQNVNVILWNKGQKVEEQKSNSKGYFRFELEFDSLYKLTFEKEGYISKSVEVDTRNMMEEDKHMGYDVGMFKVSMTKPSVGIAVGLYKKPMARFVYDARTQNYIVDRSYKKERKEEFKKVEQKELEPIKF